MIPLARLQFTTLQVPLTRDCFKMIKTSGNIALPNRYIFLRTMRHGTAHTHKQEKNICAYVQSVKKSFLEINMEILQKSRNILTAKAILSHNFQDIYISL